MKKIKKVKPWAISFGRRPVFKGASSVKPTLGRIVHYLEKGYVYPGIVVDVGADSIIGLVFWNSFGDQMFRHSVPFTTKIAAVDGHWFWPPMPRPVVEDLKAPECKHLRRHKSTIEPGASIECLDCGKEL
jgi:hypothetical protein